MYLCDPNRGRARRSRLAGELSGFIRRDEKQDREGARRICCIAWAGSPPKQYPRSPRKQSPVADDVLIERVRSRLGHVVVSSA